MRSIRGKWWTKVDMHPKYRVIIFLENGFSTVYRDIAPYAVGFSGHLPDLIQ